MGIARITMLEPIEDQYKKIGYIARSHGVKGEVLIISRIGAPQLFDEIELAHIQNARGDLVPARIESVRAQQKNNRLSFFVKFEHVTDRNQAEQLKDLPVYVSRDKTDGLVDEEKQVDLNSFDVVDEQGTRIGTVQDIIENPAHPILEVITEDDRTLLIPMVDHYVVSVDEEQETVKCHNINQLADL